MEEHPEIFKKAAASLPAGWTVRPLRRTDYARGFLTCLQALTWIGDVDEAAFTERYDWLANQGKDWYHCIVVDDGSKIVATATMIIERKFIQNLTMVAHVEEVSVLKECQGTGLGYKVVTTLNHLAKAMGVGKMTLHCSDKNVEFYRKCDYDRGGPQMHLSYMPEDAGQ